MENGEENYGTNVEFEEGYQTNSFVNSNTPKMIGWVIDYSGGLVKDERGASYVLFGLVGLIVIVSLFLLFSGGRVNNPPSAEEVFLTTPPSNIPLPLPPRR
jgi:hypothetical protein